MVVLDTRLEQGLFGWTTLLVMDQKMIYGTVNLEDGVNMIVDTLKMLELNVVTKNMYYV
jgi:hypothetical protein